jgi:hypothetical protein
MIKKILLTGVALAAAILVVSSMPDLARYVKMRQM